MASPETVAALDARADPDVKNKLGTPPLFEAAVARERFDVAEPIVRARPDAPKSQRVGRAATGAPATTLPDAPPRLWGRDAAVAWLAARGAEGHARRLARDARVRIHLRSPNSTPRRARRAFARGRERNRTSGTPRAFPTRPATPSTRTPNSRKRLSFVRFS